MFWRCPTHFLECPANFAMSLRIPPEQVGLFFDINFQYQFSIKFFNVNFKQFFLVGGVFWGRGRFWGFGRGFGVLLFLAFVNRGRTLASTVQGCHHMNDLGGLTLTLLRTADIIYVIICLSSISHKKLMSQSFLSQTLFLQSSFSTCQCERSHRPYSVYSTIW